LSTGQGKKETSSGQQCPPGWHWLKPPPGPKGIVDTILQVQEPQPKKKYTEDRMWQAIKTQNGYLDLPVSKKKRKKKGTLKKMVHN